jgi:hypothetical protein
MRISAKIGPLTCVFVCLLFSYGSQGKSSKTKSVQSPSLEGQSSPAQSSPGAQFDGPAELPRIYIKSSLADTPAPGKVLALKAGGDLQDALNQVACGDTITLEAGATFTGTFLLPKKPCDDAHWIIVRTSASDRALPAEGTRLTPCYAGVASLPGRPDFHCISTENVMAKIVFPRKAGSGPIFVDNGANHYRFIGIEVTREAPGASIVTLFGPKEKAAADHIIFDRVWLHGTAHDETRRALFWSGARYMALVDSFLSDFHCTAVEGACIDAQTVAGAAGDLPMGPYKIVNNFLEASGENVMFGGGAATQTPTDIEIRHNYFFKPILWMKGQPGFIGGNNGHPFIVKNLFELKNAQRVLFEGNVLENAWGGFSQVGNSIVLTPKNSDGRCSLCQVTDITIRYCKLAHMGGGLGIGNVADDHGNFSAAGERYSIHDVVVDDIDGEKYTGHGAALKIISNTPQLKDVKIDHITAPSSRVAVNLGIKNGKMANFTLTNSLIGAREKDLTSTGGQNECVFQAAKMGPASALLSCVDSAKVTHNAIIGGFAAWPSGNYSPKDLGAVGFEKGEGLNQFRLCKAKDTGCKGPSKFSGAGTDGKDLGANIDLLSAAIKGVI